MNSKKQTYLLLGIIALLLLSIVGAIAYKLFPRETGVKDNDDKHYSVTGDISWYDENEKEYTLTTADQLLGFAELSREVSFKDKTVKLGADIIYNEGDATSWKEDAPENEWIAIENFEGTFDGQGHTISGLYANVWGESMGMFVNAEGAVIQDFKLVNSYYSMSGDDSVGGIVAKGGATVKRVYTDIIIDCDGWYAGGIFATVQYDGTSEIEECWFDGEINMTGRYGSGIVAASYEGETIIKHCLNTGSVTSTFEGQLSAGIGGICGVTKATMHLSDCLNIGEIVSTNNRPEVGSIIGVSTGKTTIESAWAAEESSVTGVGSGLTNGCARTTALEAMLGYGGYTRTDLDFDTYWAVVEKDTPILAYFAEEIPSIDKSMARTWKIDLSWYDKKQSEYLITTAEQLLGLTALSKGGETFYGKIVRLGADIVYNTGAAAKYADEIPMNVWIPIKDFYGMFDGQGHTVSGLYAFGNNDMGVFAKISPKAVVKNLKVTNSYFHCKAESGNKAAGGLAGAGGGTISNIYVDAIVVHDGAYAGGILGLMNQNGSISNCWFAGQVTVGNKFGGGIVGVSTKQNKILTTGTIEHCLNTGTIYKEKEAKSTSTLGGIIGAVMGNNMTINDCFNSGTVTSARIKAGTFDEVGSIVGCIGSSSTCKIDNAWATVESASKAIYTLKEDSDYTVRVCHSVTEAGLEGNRACYLTTLDFGKYWTAVSNGTPILKTFAKTVLKANGYKQPDTSWYKKNASTYVLDSVEDLYGFAALTTYNGFAGKTVKLGADITVNSGNAESWATSVPEYVWTPINNFKGTFDGQGHTISGLYGKSDTPMGLFTATTNETVIQNLKVTNSYFETSVHGLSAISSHGRGTFRNIYADATLVGTGGDSAGSVGGILGFGMAGPVTIENCWSDCTIKTDGKRAGGILGSANAQAATVNIKHCLNTGTITYTGTSTTSMYRFFGGIVGTTGKATDGKTGFTMDDCLNTGTVTTSGGTNKAQGAVIGQAEGIVNITNTYALDTSTNNSKTIGLDSHTSGDVGIFFRASSALKGASAKLSTSLDFKNYWSAVTGTSPILKLFASTSDDTDSFQIDTTWFDTSKNSGTITTTNHLYGFALLVDNGTFNSKSKVYLGADITVNQGTASDWATSVPEYVWTPISNFTGTFDGQGHTISGLYGKSNTKMGLFTATTNTTLIQNLKVTNSYFESSVNGLAAIAGGGLGTFKNIYAEAILVGTGGDSAGAVGGIIGEAEATKGTALTIENCWSNCTINADGKRVGGILGSANTSHVAVSIKHCLNTGTITYTGTYAGTYRFFGGLVGATGNNTANPKTGSFTMDDCLNTGTVTVASGSTNNAQGAIIGQGLGNVNITNTYALETTTNNNKTIGNGSPSGTVSLILKPYGALKGKSAKTNTDLDFENYWSVVGGATPVLKTFAPTNSGDDDADSNQPDTTWFDTATNSGTIMTTDQLYGFASLAEDGTFNGSSKVYLGADITVNEGTASDWATAAPEYKWTPIFGFAGTFDGNGHSISGLYGKSDTTMGLFTDTTSTTVIQNLTVTNSYFETSVSGLATISGAGHGTFKNIYADAILVGTGGDSHGLVGGILGEAKATKGTAVTIENCWSNCTMKVDGKRVGGILGSANASHVTVSIKHCLNTGTITHTSASAGWRFFGGIVGATGSAAAGSNGFIMDDCLNTGTITTSGGANKAQGAVIGQAGGEVNITNTFALNTSINNNLAIGNGSPTGTVSISLKTANELAGDNAKTQTSLDFVNYWSVVDGATPVLKSFAETFKVDTTWFDTATNSGTIMTRNHLYGFAALVAEGKLNSSSKVYLGADITVNEGTASEWATTAPEYVWTPISGFAGTFDGQGYTISGLYGNSDTDMGFFTATTSTTVVKDLKVTNSYFATSGNAVGLGAIVGSGHGTFQKIYADAMLVKTGGYDSNGIGGILGCVTASAGTVVIENCWSNCTINADGKRIGGILGSGNASVATVSVKHCLNTGAITYTGTSTATYRFYGGLIGATGTAKVVSGSSTFIMEDCLSTGTLTTSGGTLNAKGGIIGQVGGTLNITKTYALKTGTYITVLIGNGSYTSDTVSFKTTDELKGNNAKTNTALDFKNYWVAVDGATPMLKTFTEASQVDTTWFDTTTNSGTITTANQLYGFASLVADGTLNSSSKVYLGADITVNQGTASEWATTAPEYVWTPISGFAGTFDGKGYTISGLYGNSDTDMGLFTATASSSVVKDLKVTNSYFATSGNAVGLGAIVGSGHGTFQKIYADAILVKTGGYDSNGIGGILGCVTASAGTVIIENCWSNCTINADGKRIGGILGSGNASVATVSVKHCLNTGAITYTGTSTATYRFYGGLIGATGTAKVVSGSSTFIMEDCLSTGTLTTSGGTLNAKGGIIGQVGGTLNITKTYALKTGTYVSVLIGNGTYTADTVSFKTAEELKGDNAKTSTNLDFENYWSAVEGKTPVLHVMRSNNTLSLTSVLRIAQSNNTLSLRRNQPSTANDNMLNLLRSVK